VSGTFAAAQALEKGTAGELIEATLVIPFKV
jgi:hypothetical protein